MQNTVVLFSNTDKFVLMQVPHVTGVVLILPVRPGRLTFGVCVLVGGHIGNQGLILGVPS